MKTMKSDFILVIVAIIGLSISSCKKSGNSTTPPSEDFTNAQIDQVQNSDVQDALADKTDQDIDNSINQLQAANYQVSTPKFLSASGSFVITVDHPDSTTFPKVITFVYTNFQDSTADESFVINGELDITITANATDKQLITWDQVFKQFSVTTDSTVFTLNGTRTIERTGHAFSFKGLEGLRVTTTDNITGSLSYAIAKIGSTDTLKFTRVLSRLRNAIFHFDNLGGIYWQNRLLRFNLSKDTVTWSGTVTGINEKGDPYTKSVGAASPLIVNFFLRTPVITSGIMEYTTNGSTPESYTITFKEDPDHPRYTLITVTNNTTFKTFSFDRRFGRKFRRWW